MNINLARARKRASQLRTLAQSVSSVGAERIVYTDTADMIDDLVGFIETLGGLRDLPDADPSPAS